LLCRSADNTDCTERETIAIGFTCDGVDGVDGVML
jgi:hypothetical protein